MEHLDAAVDHVGHGHDPAWAEGYACNVSKLAGAISIRSADLIGKCGRLGTDRKRGRQPQLKPEHLDAGIAHVSDDKRPAWAKCHALGPIELARALPRRPQRKGIRAVGMEHLDAVVSRVGHGHDPAGANGNAAGPGKLAVACPQRSELECECAVCMEHLDAVVSRVGHGHDPAGANGNVTRSHKLPCARPKRPELKGKRGASKRQVAQRRDRRRDLDRRRRRRRRVEYLDAIVAPIGHCHDPAWAESDACSVAKLACAISMSP